MVQVRHGALPCRPVWVHLGPPKLQVADALLLPGQCKWLHSLLNILWPRIDKFLGAAGDTQTRTSFSALCWTAVVKASVLHKPLV